MNAFWSFLLIGRIILLLALSEESMDTLIIDLETKERINIRNNGLDGK